MDLGATEGCREAIACLEMHCNLLKGSTSKEVLEVFYQEVGIRLQQYVDPPSVRTHTNRQDLTTTLEASNHIFIWRIPDHCRLKRISWFRIFIKATAYNGRFRKSQNARARLYRQ